jgi:hypothetical protein
MARKRFILLEAWKELHRIDLLHLPKIFIHLVKELEAISILSMILSFRVVMFLLVN